MHMLTSILIPEYRFINRFSKIFGRNNFAWVILDSSFAPPPYALRAVG